MNTIILSFVLLNGINMIQSACPLGYYQQIGDISGLGSVNGVGQGQSVANCEACAKLCSGQAHCNSFECSPSQLKCNLNAAANPSILTSYGDYKFCTKEGCPVGYYQQIGDIGGWGSVNGAGQGQSVANCEACAKLCSGQAHCNSFECSPSQLKCNLNAAANPSILTSYGDYKFCTKEGCPVGYYQQIGDIGGWGSINGDGGGQSVANCGECATLCS
eukprot:422686_1